MSAAAGARASPRKLAAAPPPPPRRRRRRRAAAAAAAEPPPPLISALHSPPPPLRRCHSDIHTVKSEWGPAAYPLVPGHEAVGTVTAVGANVTSFAVGDAAGVGVMVGSCGGCASCAAHEEQFCSSGGPVFTYGSIDARHKADGVTQGGYSSHIVVDQKFALKFPAALDRAAGAPLLCAGITVYSPLRHFKLDRPGMRIGVVGLGGLGHMAVKFIKAFGGHCT